MSVPRKFTDFDPLQLEIVPGVRVADLKTREECDNALVRIELDTESIQAQINRSEASVEPPEPGWRSRAQGAIRWKKRTRHAVKRKRDALPAPAGGDKRRALLLDTFRQELGDVEFERILDVAKARHPAAFDADDGGTRSMVDRICALERRAKGMGLEFRTESVETDQGLMSYAGFWEDDDALILTTDINEAEAWLAAHEAERAGS